MQEIQMARKTAAYKIHMDIMAAGDVAAEAFSTFCRLLKTMRDDKLYQELEYSSFEAYCENAVGIKQSQAYNYIKASEDFGEEKFQSIGKLGIRKLQLIGTVPQESREEFIDQNKLQEMTTREVEAAVKEYKAKLEQANKDADRHMMRAREAEFELEKRNAAMDALKQELEYAKKHGNSDDIKKLQDELEFRTSQVRTTENRMNDAVERLEIQLKEQEDLAKRQVQRADEKARDAKQMELTVIELRKHIDKLNREKPSEDNQAEIKRLQATVTELTEQLHEKPIEVPAVKTVEVVPEFITCATKTKINNLIETAISLTDEEIDIYIHSKSDSNRIYEAIKRLENLMDAIE
jgi:chromosome segregation ATPase